MQADYISWLPHCQHWQDGAKAAYGVGLSAFLYLLLLSDSAGGKDHPRNGNEPCASPVRGGGKTDEGEPGSSFGGAGQETPADPGDGSEQRREGQKPPAGCEYTHTDTHTPCPDSNRSISHPSLTEASNKPSKFREPPKCPHFDGRVSSGTTGSNRPLFRAL